MKIKGGGDAIPESEVDSIERVTGIGRLSSENREVNNESKNSSSKKAQDNLLRKL